MKAVMNPDTCIGSGNREAVCPRVFKLINGVSEVLVDTVPPEEEKRLRNAVDGCPWGAITVED
jgi:ferredoxin